MAPSEPHPTWIWCFRQNAPNESCVVICNLWWYVFVFWTPKNREMDPFFQDVDPNALDRNIRCFSLVDVTPTVDWYKISRNFPLGDTMEMDTFSMCVPKIRQSVNDCLICSGNRCNVSWSQIKGEIGKWASVSLASPCCSRYRNDNKSSFRRSGIRIMVPGKGVAALSAKGMYGANWSGNWRSNPALAVLGRPVLVLMVLLMYR